MSGKMGLSTATMLCVFIAVIDSAQNDHHFPSGFRWHNYDHLQPENAYFSCSTSTAEEYQPSASSCEEHRASNDQSLERKWDLESQEIGDDSQYLDMNDYTFEIARAFGVSEIDNDNQAATDIATKESQTMPDLDTKTRARKNAKETAGCDNDIVGLPSGEETTPPPSKRTKHGGEGGRSTACHSKRTMQDADKQNTKPLDKPVEPMPGAEIRRKNLRSSHSPKETKSSTVSEEIEQVRKSESSEKNSEATGKDQGHTDLLTQKALDLFPVLSESEPFFMKLEDFSGNPREYKKNKDRVKEMARFRLVSSFLEQITPCRYFRVILQIFPEPKDYRKQLSLLLCLIFRSFDLYKYNQTEESGYFTKNVLCVKFFNRDFPGKLQYVHYTEVDEYDGLYIDCIRLYALLDKPLSSHRKGMPICYGALIYEYIRGALLLLDYKKLAARLNTTTQDSDKTPRKMVQVFLRPSGDILLFGRPLSVFPVNRIAKEYCRLIRFFRVRTCVHVFSVIGEIAEKNCLVNLVDIVTNSLSVVRSNKTTEAAESSKQVLRTIPYGHDASDNVIFLLVPAFSDFKKSPVASQYNSAKDAMRQIYGDKLRENAWLKAISKDEFENAYRILIALETDKEVSGKDPLERTGDIQTKGTETLN